MPASENKGNLITRRAFSGESFERSHRMPALRHVVNKAMSTAYRMTEEVGEYGSGTPSPLHVVCELIRELEKFDIGEGCEISTAQEVAEYPMRFLRQLRGERATDSDAVTRLNYLLKSVSDAFYMLRGRDLKDLTLSELKDFGQKLMNACAAASEIEGIADTLMKEQESAYVGAGVR